MAEDTVHNVRLIYRPQLLVVIPIILVVFVSVISFAFFMANFKRTHPDPTYAVDLSSASEGQSVRVEAAGGHVLAWVDGQKGSELRVYDLETGNLIGSYRYPPAAVK